jgi:ATP-dependent Lhr-like helicase
MQSLPEPFASWFARQGWAPRPHQLAMLQVSENRESVLLMAPTGGGKTLAGFLPSLIALAKPRRQATLHTLYISPLKSLAADIARNLTRPVTELNLPIRIETRSGDTSASRRARQRASPPDILLTTPESLALLLTLPDSATLFAKVQRIVIDEVHALAGTKRGDQLALCLAALRTLAPSATTTALSATVARPRHIARYANAARIIETTGGAAPDVQMLLPEGPLPWAGHMGLAAAPQILAKIAQARLTIVFVNTRAQAELLFQAIWRINSETLPIALHHGSLEIAARRKAEAAMAEGRLRAIIATATLDSGIDWPEVDQIIQAGAPKGVSRLLQRIGRANHRMDEASRALLVPGNRFEVLECEAAIIGVAARALDGEPPRPGGLDVLAQHLLARACAAPFDPDAMFAEVTTAQPYETLTRKDFGDVLEFAENGGYALAAYERHRKLFRDSTGLIHIRNARIASQARMNLGTIVDVPMLKVALLGKSGRGRGIPLGEVEEYFGNMLRPGDTFLFAGRLLRFVRLHQTTLEAQDGGSGDPMVPAYSGSRMPLTTNMAATVRELLQTPSNWHQFPAEVREWLRLQRGISRLPGRDDLLVETFPRNGKWYLVAYAFEGHNAHQTLGMLVTKRMSRAGMMPLGFVATDYVLAIWSARRPAGIAELFAQDMLGDDVDAWMAESSMLRRTFRNVATIAGLVNRNTWNSKRSPRAATVNTDLIYDVLRRHQPDHVLLRATRADAAQGLTGLDRIASMLARVKGRIVHMALSRVSPLAVPVLLQIGRETVRSEDDEEALLAESEAIIAEAAGEEAAPRRARQAQADLFSM